MLAKSANKLEQEDVHWLINNRQDSFITQVSTYGLGEYILNCVEIWLEKAVKSIREKGLFRQTVTTNKQAYGGVIKYYIFIYLIG